MIESNLDDIAARLRNAAVSPELWPSALTQVSRFAGGSGCLLFSTDNQFPNPPSSPNMEEVSDDYGRGNWHLGDLRYRSAPHLLQSGIATEQDFIEPEEIAKSPFYQDFLGRWNLRWFAGVGFRAGDDMWCLSIQRNITQGPFQASELAKLKALWRPFSDAATLARLIDSARLPFLTDALELIGHAAVVCDPRGSVLRLNQSAERLIGPLVDPANKTLRFKDSNSAAAFSSLIRSAIKDELAPITQSRSVIVRDLKNQPLLIRAVVLTGTSRLIFLHGSILLLIKRHAEPLDAKLRNLYGLTAAETAVALMLLEGRAPRAISEKLGVQDNTVRAHLKSIFAKTNTHRQAELTAMLSRLASGDND